MRDLAHISTTVTDALIVVGTVGAFVAGLLPPLAAAASIFWVGWQWYHHPANIERRKLKQSKDFDPKEGT